MLTILFQGEFDQELIEKHTHDLEEVVADEGESWSQFEDGKFIYYSWVNLQKLAQCFCAIP